MISIGIALFVAALCYVLVTRVGTLLVYFQQEEYDGGRFLRATLRIPLFDVLASCVVLLLILVRYLLPQAGDVAAVAGGLALAGIGLREGRYRFKKRAVVTDRLRRIRVVALALLLPTLLLPFAALPSAFIVLQLPPLVIWLANRLLSPAQSRINERYVDEARDKLASYTGTRIAITGSFGKTTVKHLLGDLLNQVSSAYYSRGSVNTVLGLTRHIRERLQHGHRFLIAELGAYGVGSIRRLCEFIQPTVGLITAIGDAHTERFGSREAVGRAKGELAQWVVSNGGVMAVTEQVATFEPIATLVQTNRDQFLLCGDSEEADIVVESRLGEMCREVDLTIRPMGNRRLKLQIASLGAYEALNVGLVVAVLTRVAPDALDQLPFLLPNLPQVPHRLEIKDVPGQALVLDDAYNSNEIGFRSAIDVMRGLADNRGGRAILITPGIIELGAEHDTVHAILGAYCALRCDVVILVNAPRIGAFVEAFDKAGGRAHLIKTDTLTSARAALQALSPQPSDVVLYENDLPDLHETSRIL